MATEKKKGKKERPEKFDPEKNNDPIVDLEPTLHDDQDGAMTDKDELGEDYSNMEPHEIDAADRMFDRVNSSDVHRLLTRSGFQVSGYDVHGASYDGPGDEDTHALAAAHVHKKLTGRGWKHDHFVGQKYSSDPGAMIDRYKHESGQEVAVVRAPHGEIRRVDYHASTYPHLDEETRALVRRILFS